MGCSFPAHKCSDRTKKAQTGDAKVKAPGGLRETMEPDPGANEAAGNVRSDIVRRFIALVALATLGTAAVWTLRLAYADRLFHTGLSAAVVRARELAPGNATYFKEAGDYSERPVLEAAVALDPFYSHGWIELGLGAELAGDTARAERLLLDAARVDKTYEPRWTLASFYFRRGEREGLWRWAKKALEISYQDQTPLFQLCWRMSSDPAEILSGAIPRQPRILAQYLSFLMQREDLDAAEAVGDLLAPQAGEAETPVLLYYCDRLLQKGRERPALRVWNTLCLRRRIDRQPLEPGSGVSLTNGEFSAAPLETAFDWRLAHADGIALVVPAGPAGGLRASFSSKQPEAVRVLEQVLPVLPSRRYRLRFSYRTEGVAPGSGLRWEIARLTGGAEWSAGSADLSGENWKQEELDFTTPPDMGSGRLALNYRRALGTTRIEGAVWLRKVSLDFAPQ
jgi:tetratricopeptide (TPR) repeat protein